MQTSSVHRAQLTALMGPSSSLQPLAGHLFFFLGPASPLGLAQVGLCAAHAASTSPPGTGNTAEHSGHVIDTDTAAPGQLWDSGSRWRRQCDESQPSQRNGRKSVGGARNGGVCHAFPITRDDKREAHPAGGKRGRRNGRPGLQNPCWPKTLLGNWVLLLEEVVFAPSFRRPRRSCSHTAPPKCYTNVFGTSSWPARWHE